VLQILLTSTPGFIAARARKKISEQFLASFDARNPIVGKICVELGDVLPQFNFALRRGIFAKPFFPIVLADLKSIGNGFADSSEALFLLKRELVVPE
jgi:hypothetical protein